MKESKYLAGAFDAYGLADTLRTGRHYRVSLFTTSDTPTYVERIKEYSGLGYIKTFKGRWHWVCDNAAEIQQFYIAVGPHLIPDKRKLIEVAWEEWRRRRMDDADDPRDPGPIDGPLYPELQEDDEQVQVMKRGPVNSRGW